MRCSNKLLGLAAAVAVLMLGPAPAATQEIPLHESLENTISAAALCPAKLHAKWGEVREALNNQDLPALNDRLLELNEIRLAAGLDGLDEYSLFLAQAGIERAQKGRREEARLLLRKALQISPESPDVLLRLLPWLPDVGAGSMLGSIALLIRRSLFDPYYLLSLTKRMIYPTLLALTVALFLSFIVVLATRIDTLCRVLARSLPVAWRGVLLPPLILVLFVAPLITGPLWALFIWGGAVRYLLPEKRILSVFTALMLVAWGVFVPLRENISEWVDSTAVRTVALARTSVLTPELRDGLREQLGRWDDDPIVQFKYAQLMRQVGDLPAAAAALQRAELLAGKRPEFDVERAMLTYLQGKSSEADSLLTQVREQGHRSAPFFFNHSKVKFDLTDTKSSREYYASAYDMDRTFSELMKDREDLLGLYHPRAIADEDLPFWQYAKTAMVPRAGSFERAQNMTAMIVPGCDPQTLTWVGVVMLIIYLSGGKSPRRVKPQGVFEGYDPSQFVGVLVHLVPGGPWVAGARPALGLLVLTAVLVLLTPLLEYPLEGSLLGDVIPSVGPYYLFGFLLIYFGAVYLGYLVEEES